MTRADDTPDRQAVTLEEVLGAARPRRVRSGDVMLASLVWPGDDAAVLLAHATGFHKEIWAPTVRALRASGVTATVVAMDLRGHGDSAEPPGEPVVWDYARDVLAVADALLGAAQRRIGVGHSLGGMAVATAQTMRPTFDHLVLMDPALISPERGKVLIEGGQNPWAEGARRRRAAFATRDEAYETYQGKSVFATWPDELLRLYVDHGFEARDGEWTLKCRPEWEAATFSQPSFIEVWEPLGHLDVPVTLLTAEHSTTHPPDVALEVAELLRARHVRLEGVSHFIPMEVPDAVAAHVAAALEETEPERG